MATKLQCQLDLLQNSFFLLSLSCTLEMCLKAHLSRFQGLLLDTLSILSSNKSGALGNCWLCSPIPLILLQETVSEIWDCQKRVLGSLLTLTGDGSLSRGFVAQNRCFLILCISMMCVGFFPCNSQLLPCLLLPFSGISDHGNFTFRLPLA